MTYVRLGTKAVGSIVKLKESGVAVNYIVVHQGLPSNIYDSSCNGVWLLRQDVGGASQYVSTVGTDFKDSIYMSYLNNTFLALLDKDIQNNIISAKLPYHYYSGSSITVKSGSNGLSAKIFPLSIPEVGITAEISTTYPDGTVLSYFSDDTASKRIAYYNGNAWSWGTRSMSNDRGEGYRTVTSNGSTGSHMYNASAGVRPAMILPTTLWVDTTGLIYVNPPPSEPASITVPTTINGGESLTVSWGAATDVDGDLLGYNLERSVNGGSYVVVYTGTALSYVDSITKGWNTVAYRVRAYDSNAGNSSYTTSATRTINNNSEPVITCSYASGTDLGTKDSGFSISYSVDDVDGDVITVTEALDGVTKRQFTATTGQNYSFAVTGDYFMQVLNGSHTLTISADDGTVTTVYTLYFNKLVSKATITLSEPMQTDAQITVTVLAVTGNIPADADFKVEVTNNANDATPVWEDCTSAVKSGTNYVFENTTAVNGYAFNFRITAERANGGEGGYITSVQGGFQ